MSRRRSHPVEFRRAQTIEEYLAQGGVVTKCPSRAANFFAPGTASIDGVVLGLGRCAHETLPPHLLTVETYDEAQYDPEYAVQADMWAELEDDSRRCLVPAEAQTDFATGREDEANYAGE